LIAPSNGPWDDCFTEVRGVPKVIWEDALSISIECDSPYWVVYDQDSEGVCVEPQTAPPDAANLGIAGDSYIESLFVFDEI
jgi:aldose 1-epimerase